MSTKSQTFGSSALDPTLLGSNDLFPGWIQGDTDRKLVQPEFMNCSPLHFGLRDTAFSQLTQKNNNWDCNPIYAYCGTRLQWAQWDLLLSRQDWAVGSICLLAHKMLINSIGPQCFYNSVFSNTAHHWSSEHAAMLWTWRWPVLPHRGLQRRCSYPLCSMIPTDAWPSSLLPFHQPRSWGSWQLILNPQMERLEGLRMTCPMRFRHYPFL